MSSKMEQYVDQAISDFNSIRDAIKNKGIDVPKGTDTKNYGKLIDSINTLQVNGIIKQYQVSEGSVERGDFVEFATGDSTTVRKAETITVPVGIANTAGVSGDIIEVYCVIQTMAIALNVSNVTYTGDSTVRENEITTFMFVANEGYALPETVTVTNAEHKWNSDKGELAIFKPTDTVNIIVECVQIPLDTPTISINETILTIMPVANAVSYQVLANGENVATVVETSVDLSTIITSSGNYEVSVIAVGEPYANSAASEAVVFTVEEKIKSYLTFSSPSTFTLKVGSNTKYWDGTLEYSTDAVTWNAWDGTAISSSADGKLYMRGVGNTLITGNNPYKYGSPTATWVFTGNSIACEGNIETLLDYATVAAGEHPEMADYCYYYMFRGWTSLTTAPELPSPTLTQYCYGSMFYNCKSITTAPELPVTTLANGCYSNMFQNCTSLTTAPELPATTLADYCYNYMFSGCTALITAPELPATTLANGCYTGMFDDCTSLTTIPKLPATTLATDCYNYMFSGCTALITAPELPSTTLAEGCYDSMFYGCTALTTIPKLPATTLATDCYRSMFSNCTSVKFSTSQSGIYQTAYRIPMSGTGTTANSALMGMFWNTGGTFKGNDIGTPSINTTYYLSTSNTVV